MEANINSKLHQENIKLNDLWAFIFVYPLLAFLSVHIGNDNSFRQLLQIPSYYSDIMLALFCSYGAGFYLKKINIFAEKNISWENQFKRRIIYHFLYGIAIPLIVIIGIEAFYVSFLLKIQVQDTSILYLEMPIVAIFLIGINLMYIMLYFRKKNFELSERILIQEKIHSKSNLPEYQTQFLVNNGNKTPYILVGEVAYFYLKHKSVFLATRSNQHYLYNQSLEQINKNVDPTLFFQLNRQVITNRQSVKSYSNTATRKLSIELFPATTEDIFVSKTRASSFLKWLKKK